MSEVAKKVELMARPIIEKMGYELVDVSFGKVIDSMELNISIYNPKANITIEDCEKVSKALDEPLEVLNPTNDKPYNLVVGSIGLDRPMTKTKDFERNLGLEIEIKLYVAQNKQKEFCGKLEKVDEKEIVLDIQNEKLTIARENIASAKLYIKF